MSLSSFGFVPNGSTAMSTINVLGATSPWVAEVGGAVIIERGPRALRERIDPWGAVPPPALAVMRAIKTEFDPRAVLNPGRFVGGL